MVPMFGTQSVTFWYSTSFPNSVLQYDLPTLTYPYSYPKRERGRKGGRGKSARPSGTIASHPPRLRVTVARPSDGPPRRSIARETPCSITRERAINDAPFGVDVCGARPRVPAINDDAIIRRRQLQRGSFVHTATVILSDKVALSASSGSLS